MKDNFSENEKLLMIQMLQAELELEKKKVKCCCFTLFRKS